MRRKNIQALLIATHVSYVLRNAVLLCILATAAWAQVTPNSLITKLPTAHWIFQADGALGTDAPLYQISSLATDPSGNIIFADPGNKVVLRLNADGTVTVLAGNGVQGYSGDGGPALSASLTNPTDAVMDSQGNLYIYDNVSIDPTSRSSVIRRVSNGIITTFVTGIGTRLAVDTTGNLYVAGSNCQIKRIASDGSVSVFSGTGTCGHSGDGQKATQADMSPGGIAFDASGNLYFAEYAVLASQVISYVRKITTDGTIYTIAGNGTTGFSSNAGPALSTPLNHPHSVAVDSAGNVFVSEEKNEIIRRITFDGFTYFTSIVAGSDPTRYGFTGDGGPATGATFLFPAGLALDGAGNLYVADSGNFRIRRIQAGTISTVAGNGQFRLVPDGTPSSQAFLYGPASIAFDLSGNLMISEPSFAKVAWVMSMDDSFQVLAGIGTAGRGLEGGPANRALLATPRQLATDAQGKIYIADSDASVIYEVTDGRLVKFAGQQAFITGDEGDNGPALSASFNNPFGIAVDPLGNVFVADTGNNVIRKIGSDGNITRYAGLGDGRPGYSGDNGLATAAQLNSPRGLAIDAVGNLLVCDYNNHRIRSISPAGTISTIAGNGVANTVGDGGPASQASVNSPSAIAIDIDGGIFVVTSGGRRLRRIDTFGIISTIAGDGVTLTDQGDGGPAGKALLDTTGVAVDSSGNVFLTSSSSDVIRVILNFEPFLHLSQQSFSDFPVTSVSLKGVSHGAPSAPQPFTVTGDFTGVLFNATADSAWITLFPKNQGSTPSTMVFVADPSKLSPGSYVGHIKLTRVGAAAPFATVTVRFNVTVSAPPKLSVQPLNLTLSAALGSTTQQTQTIYISNTGSGSLDYQLNESGLPSGALKLLDASTSGTVKAGDPPLGIKIFVDPSKLSLGAFVGTLLVKSSTSNETQSIPVAISITSKPQRMALSQRGFTFTAVQGGGVTPAQSFAVVNPGGGSFDWTAKAMTLGGSAAWLSISALAGTSAAGSTPPSITVSVDPTVLSSPGVYYGIVRVSSPNAADAPQDVEVVLYLQGANANAEPVASRYALVFAAPAGASSPSSQTITITNLNASPVGVSPSTSTYDGTPWLTVAPDTPQQQIAAGGSLKLIVATSVVGLQPKLYQGTLLLQFPSPLRNLEVDVRLIVTGSGGSGVTADGNGAPEATNCPSQLIPVFTSLPDNFVASAAWPLALEATVTDDCGNRLKDGTVIATFTNGDAPLRLLSLGDGRYQGTWTGASKNAGQLQITLKVDSNSAPILHAEQSYNGSLQPNNDAPPTISPGGVSSAAGPAMPTVGAGSIISIRGNSFAQNGTVAHLPLITDLAGSRVILAGLSLPMIYTSGALINALVPYDAQPGQYVAIVEQDNKWSFPEPVVIGSAQPIILRITTSASQSVAQDLWSQLVAGKSIDASTIAPTNALHAGDTLTVYCTGLGAVTPALDDPGTPAPSPAPSVQNPVTLTIGGTNVPVVSATLVSGFAGIYAVQATIPGGMGDGPLVVSVASQPSPPVAVLVR